MRLSKFNVKIPRGWRRVRLGEFINGHYKFYNVMDNRFSDMYSVNDRFRNYSVGLRIIKKI